MTMVSPLIHQGVAVAASTVPLMARLRKTDGTDGFLQQADVQQITYNVWDENDLSQPVVADTVIPVAQVIFDALVNDAFWNFDSQGYNFRYDTKETDLPNGNRIYRVQFLIDPVVGNSFWVLYNMETVSVYAESP